MSVTREPIINEGWEKLYEPMRHMPIVDPAAVMYMHPNWPILENGIKDFLQTVMKYQPRAENPEQQRMQEMVISAIVNSLSLGLAKTCGFDEAAKAAGFAPIT